MATTKTSKALLATNLAAGTQKHLATSAALLFASGSFTPAQVVAQLTLLATLRSDADAARVTLHEKVNAEKAQAPALDAFMNAFVAFVMAMFSNSPSVLADFGLKPKKARAPLTVAQKAAAKAKRDATRKARGTKGKKQKLEVVGDVTGVTITPVTAPAALPASSAPAVTPAVPAASATTPSHGA